MTEIGDTVSVALLADVLDGAGLRGQCLGWDIVPITTDARLVGRAFTMSCEAVAAVVENRYEGLLLALDAIGPNDVVVVATDRSDQVAVWGELLSNAAIAAAAVGMITDGLIRDADEIRALGFPAFGRGTVPYDIGGRLEVVDFGVDIEIDGVKICQGDLVVADGDGVVVVPGAQEQAVLSSALDKAGGESQFREAVRNGMKPSVAYERFGVL